MRASASLQPALVQKLNQLTKDAWTELCEHNGEEFWFEDDDAAHLILAQRIFARASDGERDEETLKSYAVAPFSRALLREAGQRHMTRALDN